MLIPSIRIRRLTVGFVGVIFVLSFAGCDILGLTEDEPAPQPVTDPKAVAGMEVIGGMMEVVFEGGGEPAPGATFPDYASGTYPSGMSVSVPASTDHSVTLSITATNMTPPAAEGDVPDDVTFNGTFTISFNLNADGTQMTIAMAGSFTVTGSDAPFSTMSVESAVATIPIVDGELGEPSSMSGTLTVDGSSYDMARIDTDSGDSEGGSSDPTDAHYFLFGYRDDGGTDRPQIVYSETTDRWDMLDLPGEGYIRAAAVDGNGLIVAVGDNGMIYSSADGATWTDRSVSSVSATLNEVRTSGGTWIATGEEVILRSTNGTDWTAVWTASSGENLYAVASDGQDNWVASGAPPHILVRSSSDGTAWTKENADMSNRAPEIIQRLFWTDDDTPLIALSGSPWSGTSGGVYDGAELDDPADGLDWVLNGSSFGALAGAERDGVYAAVGTGAAGFTVRYSSDSGDSWTTASVSGSINGYIVDMKAIGNGFLATTNMGGLLRGSADATTWQVVRDESYGSWAFAYRP